LIVCKNKLPPESLLDLSGGRVDAHN